MKHDEREYYGNLIIAGGQMLTSHEDYDFSGICEVLFMVIAMGLRNDGWTKQRVIESFTPLLNTIYKDE